MPKDRKPPSDPRPSPEFKVLLDLVQSQEQLLRRTQAECEALRNACAMLIGALAEKGHSYLLERTFERLPDGREATRLEYLVQSDFASRCQKLGIKTLGLVVHLAPPIQADTADQESLPRDGGADNVVVLRPSDPK